MKSKSIECEQAHFFFTELTLIFFGEVLSGLIPSVLNAVFFITIRGSCLFVTGCCIAHGLLFLLFFIPIRGSCLFGVFFSETECCIVHVRFVKQ